MTRIAIISENNRLSNNIGTVNRGKQITINPNFASL